MGSHGKEAVMGERRSGGVVAAITLAIAAAFVAIMLLFLSQSVEIASRYAENITDLYLTEVSLSLSDLMHDEEALVGKRVGDRLRIARDGHLHHLPGRKRDVVEGLGAHGLVSGGVEL